MRTFAGLPDVTKSAEALAKLAEAFGKAGPLATLAACSVFFLLIALAAAGLDQVTHSTNAEPDRTTTEIGARLSTLDGKLIARVDALEAKLGERIARLDSQHTSISAKFEALTHLLDTFAAIGAALKTLVLPQDGRSLLGPITISIGGTGGNAPCGGTAPQRCTTPIDPCPKTDACPAPAPCSKRHAIRKAKSCR